MKPPRFLGSDFWAVFELEKSGPNLYLFPEKSSSRISLKVSPHTHWPCFG
jgi:hypothetical protein